MFCPKTCLFPAPPPPSTPSKKKKEKCGVGDSSSILCDPNVLSSTGCNFRGIYPSGSWCLKEVAQI